MLWPTHAVTEPPPPGETSSHDLGAQAKDGIFLIGELAGEVGMDAKTIRFYERAGLLNPSIHGRMRVYNPADAKRLITIRKLRQFGFSIAEIKTVRKLQGELYFEKTPCKEVLSLFEKQLNVLKQKHMAMEQTIDELAGHVSEV